MMQINYAIYLGHHPARPELARGSCRHGTRRVTCTLATVARALDRTTPAAAAAPTCRQPECAFVSVMETMEPRDGGNPSDRQ